MPRTFNPPKPTKAHASATSPSSSTARAFIDKWTTALNTLPHVQSGSAKELFHSYVHHVAEEREGLEAAITATAARLLEDHRLCRFSYYNADERALLLTSLRLVAKVEAACPKVAAVLVDDLTTTERGDEDTNECAALVLSLIGELGQGKDDTLLVLARGAAELISYLHARLVFYSGTDGFWEEDGVLLAEAANTILYAAAETTTSFLDEHTLSRMLEWEAWPPANSAGVAPALRLVAAIVRAAAYFPRLATLLDTLQRNLAHHLVIELVGDAPDGSNPHEVANLLVQVRTCMRSMPRSRPAHLDLRPCIVQVSNLKQHEGWQDPRRCEQALARARLAVQMLRALVREPPPPPRRPPGPAAPRSRTHVHVRLAASRPAQG